MHDEPCIVNRAKQSAASLNLCRGSRIKGPWVNLPETEFSASSAKSRLHSLAFTSLSISLCPNGAFLGAFTETPGSDRNGIRGQKLRK